MNDFVATDKAAALRELDMRMSETCTCTLRKTATGAVPGSGNASARIVLIGEAPGKNEDAQGIPFVGASGKLLDGMLAAAGFSRGDVYVTNIVKYRPPDNRDPSPSEIEACAEWLNGQILLIDPDLIVTLGRHAMNRFLPGMKISEVHGKAFRKTFPGIGTRFFLPLYHPAAALYNGGMRGILKEDFLRIPKVLLEAGRRKRKT